MSETQTVQIQDLPEANYDHTYAMGKSMLDVYASQAEAIPGFVIRHEVGIYDLPGVPRASTYAARLALSMRSSDWLIAEGKVEGIRATMHTDHHLDGLDFRRSFAQVHANSKEGPRAGVELEVRRLTPGVQAELRDYAAHLERASEYDKQAFLADMPDVVSQYAPIVARYRVAGGLGNRDGIVFRNGFDASRVTEGDKFLTTHKFWSMDDAGNKVDELRSASVAFILPPVRPVQRAPKPPKTGGVLSRFRKNKV